MLSFAMVAPPAIGPLAASVCAVYCDTRDPSLAREETFPVAEKVVNGRRIVLHVSNVDGMAWGSIDNGTLGNSIWLDRSWDGGPSWDGLLGKASIPGTWTGTRTLMYNIYDPSNHRRGVVRACGDAGGIACTDWVHARVCAATLCDGLNAASAVGDSQPVPEAGISNRRIGLHFDNRGLAWGTLANGRAGDEVWLDRSWDNGVSWPGGSSLGRVSVPAGATSTRTTMFHSRDTRGLLYAGAVRACGRAVEGQSGSCTAWARPANNRADAVAASLMWAYQPDTAWWLSSWWNSAVAVHTVIDYTRRTGKTDYLWVVDRTFEVNKGVFPAGVKSSDPIEGHFISRAIDDTEWWALAWIAAYDLTGNAKYLTEAVTIANYVNGFWDTSRCGGGVWWDRERTYKNAVTNGLWVRLTAALHNRLAGDTLWLNRATTSWNWFNASGMINSAGLVNDGINAACQNNGQTVWTYNQGLAFGAALEVWRATGTAQTLTRARQLADAAIGSPLLAPNGLLTESCDSLTASCDDNQKQFKGVFMRYLMELADTTAALPYRAFATTQSDRIWLSGRDSLNRIGQRWSGQTSATNPNVRDWRTQASALSAILAALPAPA
ncbi:hypothetical protein Rhe02_74350 [Rhizocola hellebori]|uniref:Glycosyl hydrolase n=1 Tax=Rhizocola hellebori TaxID=1392758 RepID=A0A8J3QH74_9ACTN|nr:hypothetical protein Rhe02_74350 [Rhizocola hellebori]